MEKRTKPCLPEILFEADMMTAQLKLHLDNSGQKFNIDELLELLDLRNVKIGIMKEEIEKMIEHDIYEVYVEVAKGKEPVRGKDGYFIFHVQNPDKEDGPKILDDGSVEYIKTEEFTIVDEGQLLAEYVPATNGEFGYTVDNAIRNPVKGVELPSLKGKGFRMEAGKYYATMHGKIDISENGIQIANLLEVAGDVDIGYGHINFDGDVYIRGDVHSNMIVRATGNIEIKGHVGSCFIDAGKSIIIKNGMQGKFAGRLRAGGDISCKFFENSQARAKGNITVKSILHSKLEAEGKIKVSGKDSVILGGSVHAVQGLEISQAGNEMEVSTLLSAGVLSKTLKRNSELVELIKKVKDEIDLLERSAKIMIRMKQTKVTKETENRHMKIIQAKVMKDAELKQYQDERIKNEAMICSGRDATIIVQNIIFPGCRVEIAGNGIDVKEEIKHVKFLLKDGNIEAALLY